MRILLSIFALGLAVATDQADATPAIALGAAPVLGGGSYSDGGGITIAIEPRQTRDGRLAICGIWAQGTRLSAYLRKSAPQVLGKGSIAVDGAAAVSNLAFLQQTAPAETYAGAEAGCTVTDRRFTGSEQLEIRIPRQVLVRNNGDAPLRVAPAGRANPALGAGSLLPERWTHIRGEIRD